jgi:hypothetical protein
MFLFVGGAEINTGKVGRNVYLPFLEKNVVPRKCCVQVTICLEDKVFR